MVEQEFGVHLTVVYRGNRRGGFCKAMACAAVITVGNSGNGRGKPRLTTVITVASRGSPRRAPRVVVVHGGENRR